MLTLFTVALAGGSEDLATRFLAELAKGDAEATVALCTDAFRDRERLGCRALVTELIGARVEPARAVHAEDEALIEYWVHSPRDGRWPITLQARPDESGAWKFVDGSDPDGQKLETKLSLAGKPDPGALTLPQDVVDMLDALGDDAMPMPCSVEQCRIIGRSLRAHALSLRPLDLEVTGSKAVLVFLMERKGQAFDDGYLLLKKKKGAWWITAMADGRPPP